MKMKSKMMLLKVIALWFCAILVLTGCAGKAESYQDKYDLGVKYVSEGNYEEAIIALNAAIEIDPKQVDAYLTLANIYIQQNNTDAAVAVIEQGLAALGSDESLSNKLEELTTTTTTTDQEQSAETSSTERTPESFAEREKPFEELDAYLQGVIQQAVTAVINNDEQALVALCNDETFGRSKTVGVYTRIDNYKVYFFHTDNLYDLSIDIREENGVAYMANVSGRIGNDAPYTYTFSRAEGHTQSWIWNGPFTMRYVWYQPFDFIPIPDVTEYNAVGAAVNGYVDGTFTVAGTTTGKYDDNKYNDELTFENCVLISGHRLEQWHNLGKGVVNPYQTEEDNQYDKDRWGQRAYLYCMSIDPTTDWFQWVDADYISPYDMENIDWN